MSTNSKKAAVKLNKASTNKRPILSSLFITSLWRLRLTWKLQIRKNIENRVRWRMSFCIYASVSSIAINTTAAAARKNLRTANKLKRTFLLWEPWIAVFMTWKSQLIPCACNSGLARICSCVNKLDEIIEMIDQALDRSILYWYLQKSLFYTYIYILMKQ